MLLLRYIQSYFLDKESIMEKRDLCVRALNAIQSITDDTRTKTLWFEKHQMIEDSRHKLVAIYQPLKHYCEYFLPGYTLANSHSTTEFSMLYREYQQCELYLMLSDIYWLCQNIKVKFVYECIQDKKLDLLAKICTKSSKVIQKWAIYYNLYKWHLSY